MNYLKTIFFGTILFFCTNVNSQNRLMSLGSYSSVELAESFTEYSESPIIENQTYTYQYNNNEVMVVFNGKQHIEYYENKKYFIESSLTWISDKECIMTIKEFNLPNFPFIVGSKLKMEITKTKGKYIYYKSTLAGRTWEGKMKEVERDNATYAVN